MKFGSYNIYIYAVLLNVIINVTILRILSNKLPQILDNTFLNLYWFPEAWTISWESIQVYVDNDFLIGLHFALYFLLLNETMDISVPGPKWKLWLQKKKYIPLLY